MKKLLKVLRRISRKIANTLVRIIVFLFYFIFITPWGIFITLFRDYLHIRKPVGWNSCPDAPKDIRVFLKEQ